MKRNLDHERITILWHFFWFVFNRDSTFYSTEFLHNFNIFLLENVFNNTWYLSFIVNEKLNHPLIVFIVPCDQHQCIVRNYQMIYCLNILSAPINLSLNCLVITVGTWLVIYIFQLSFVKVKTILTIVMIVLP